MAQSSIQRQRRWLHVLATYPDENGIQQTRCDSRIRDREPNLGIICPRCLWWLRVMDSRAEKKMSEETDAR